MKLPKLRELIEALRSFFSRPYTTKFPLATFTPAPQYRGRPHYYEDNCVGCGACVQVCPAGALEFSDSRETGFRTFTIRFPHCIQCGQCEEKCLTKTGIRLVNETIPSTFDRDAETESMKKKILWCEYCGGLIACRDHLLWLSDRLGPYSYALPALLLLKEEHFQSAPEVLVKDEIRREDLHKSLCPYCRRQVAIADVFR
ncbi:MAG: 4Fe-4S dicluster domain-containing protein [Bacillota bacterium]